MKVLQNRNALDICLRLLNWVGQHPQKVSTWTYILIVYVLTSVIITTPLIFMKLSQAEGDPDVLAATCESITSMYQITVKLVWMIFYRKQLAELLYRMDRFWPTNLADDDEEVKKELSFVNNTNWFFVFVHSNMALALCPTFLAKAVVTWKLPLLCWLPNNDASPYFEIMLTNEVVLIAAIVIYVCSFDTLIGTLGVKISMQFKILNKHFKSALNIDVNTEKDKEKLLENLKECVDHHVFLLNFAHEYERIYSFIFMNQFIMSTATMCMELYIFSEANNAGLIVNCLIYLFNVMSELSFYCIPPTMMETESEKTANLVYSVCWEDWKSKGLYQNLQIIIARAQRAIKISACGLFYMNNELFVSVVQTSISFYTFLKNKKKQ